MNTHSHNATRLQYCQAARGLQLQHNSQACRSKHGRAFSHHKKLPAFLLTRPMCQSGTLTARGCPKAQHASKGGYVPIRRTYQNKGLPEGPACKQGGLCANRAHISQQGAARRPVTCKQWGLCANSGTSLRGLATIPQICTGNDAIWPLKARDRQSFFDRGEHCRHAMQAGHQPPAR